MKLTFAQLLGEIPKSDSSLLSQQHSVYARDVRLDRGTLRPFRQSKYYRESTKPRDQLSLYRFAAVPGDPESGYMFSWDVVVDVVRGPVAGNVQDLTYWTGEEFPKYCDNSIGTGGAVLPSNWYRLGVPAPEFGPVGAMKALPVELIPLEPSEPIDPDNPPPPEPEPDPPPPVDPDDPDNPEEPEEPEPDYGVGDASTEIDRDYVVTFLQQLGELVMEGPPSDPSNIITVPSGAGVELHNIAEPPSGPYPWSGKRLYRRIYSGGQTRIVLVTELVLGTTEYFDQLGDAEIPGDWLASNNFYAPDETMHSLGVLSNGLMFGARDNDICLTEPYLPHAWNPFYRYPVPYVIVGMGQADNQIVCVTEKNPYLLVGTNPAAMSSVELKIDQGCLSKRSIVSGGFGCAYASPDGLIMVSNKGSGLVTGDLMTRDQWQALNPRSIIGAYNEGMYIGTYEKKDGNHGTFMFDPDNKSAGLRRVSQRFTAAYHDGLMDSLLVYDPDQDAICLWDQGDDLTYTWISKANYFPMPVCMTAGRIEADSYNDLTIRLHTGLGITYSTKVTNNRCFRLPAGYRDRLVQVEVEGTDTVRMICLAETPSELD